MCLSTQQVKSTCIILSLGLLEIVYEHVFLLLKIVQEFSYIVTWQLHVYYYMKISSSFPDGCTILYWTAVYWLEKLLSFLF